MAAVHLAQRKSDTGPITSRRLATTARASVCSTVHREDSKVRRTRNLEQRLRGLRPLSTFVKNRTEPLVADRVPEAGEVVAKSVGGAAEGEQIPRKGRGLELSRLKALVVHA